MLAACALSATKHAAARKIMCPQDAWTPHTSALEAAGLHSPELRHLEKVAFVQHPKAWRWLLCWWHFQEVAAWDWTKDGALARDALESRTARGRG